MNFGTEIQEGTQMHLAAVIFDLDGVILDSFRQGMRRIKVLAAMHHLSYTRETRSRLIDGWGKPGVELLMHGFKIANPLARTMYAKWEQWDIADAPSLVDGARETLFWLRRAAFFRRCSHLGIVHMWKAC